MKNIALIFSSVLTIGFSHSGFACDLKSIEQAVGAYSDKIDAGYGTRFVSSHLHGTLKPGQKMNVLVAVDDFDVVNRTAKDVLVISLRGSNLIGASFWLAQVDAASCEVVVAGEVLGEGGHGL